MNVHQLAALRTILAGRLDVIRSARQCPDDPLTQRAGAWAMRCLWALDQMEAGATRLGDVIAELDAEQEALQALIAGP